MLPISPSAESPTSVPGSTPSRLHSVAAPLGGTSSSTAPSTSPSTFSMMPVTSCAGSPAASTASASGSANALGTFRSTSRPSICDSEVAAVPEAMFASSRKASSCISVKRGVTGRSWFDGIGHVHLDQTLKWGRRIVSARRLAPKRRIHCFPLCWGVCPADRQALRQARRSRRSARSGRPPAPRHRIPADPRRRLPAAAG